MVRVGSLFVNGSSEPLEPAIEFADERKIRHPDSREALPGFRKGPLTCGFVGGGGRI